MRKTQKNPIRAFQFSKSSLPGRVSCHPLALISQADPSPPPLAPLPASTPPQMITQTGSSSIFSNVSNLLQDNSIKPWKPQWCFLHANIKDKCTITKAIHYSTITQYSTLWSINSSLLHARKGIKYNEV